MGFDKTYQFCGSVVGQGAKDFAKGVLEATKDGKS